MLDERWRKIGLLILVTLLIGLTFWHAPPRKTFDTSVVATIIEPRNLPILVPVLANFLHTVPPSWPFKVWCSKENYNTLLSSSSLQSQIKSGRLNVTILPYEVRTSEQLSRFLTKTWFWEQFEAEYMLFFQVDSILCSSSAQGIEKYLGYEWVGSPTTWSSPGHGGNGGLSIRSIKTIKHVLSQLSRPDQEEGSYAEAEDYWFMKAIESTYGSRARWPIDGNITQLEFGYTFSQEGRQYPAPFGYHQGNADALSVINRSEPWFKEVIRNCPEMTMILDSQTGRFDA